MVFELEKKLNMINSKLKRADKLLSESKEHIFNAIGISFSKYVPFLFNYQKLSDIKEFGIHCNSHSAYLNDLFEHF
jgi:hypothetical protein